MQRHHPPPRTGMPHERVCRFPIPRTDTEKSPMMDRNLKQEQAVVEQMIRLYCRKREGNDLLCPSCRALLEYACCRLERCRFGKDKPTCRKCPVHCYRPEMKERIRAVMRWSGPRMLLYHPLTAVRHALRELFPIRKIKRKKSVNPSARS